MHLSSLEFNAAHLSEPLQASVAAYQQGNISGAMETFITKNPSLSTLTAVDFLYLYHLHFDCHAIARGQALVRCGLKYFPQHTGIQFLYLKTLLQRNRLRQASKLIDSLKHKALNEAEEKQATILQALLYAKLGYHHRPLQLLNGRSDNNHSDVQLLRTKAFIYFLLRDWEQALVCYSQCLEMVPPWSQVYAPYCDCLLSLNRVDEVRETLSRHRTNGAVQNVALDWFSCLFYFSDHDYPAAKKSLTHYLNRWPHSDYRHSCKMLLVNNEWELGYPEQARQLAREQGEPLASMYEKAKSGKPKVKLKTPFVSQLPNMCLSVAVMSVTYSQGVRIDPTQLYREVYGFYGSTIWRTVDWVKTRGFHTEFIQPEPAAVKGMLSLGIPLIVEERGLFNGHVTVVYGYDDGLNVVYVRDPMHWFPKLIPWSIFEGEISDMGHYFIALIHEHRLSQISIPDQWKSREAAALIAMQKACAMGDRVTAERCFAAIPKSHPLYLQALDSGCEVVITFRQWEKEVEQTLRSRVPRLVEKINALLNLISSGSRFPDDLIQELLNEKTVNVSYISSFIKLFTAVRNREHPAILSQLENMLAHGSETPMLWTMYGNELVEFGRVEEAIQAYHNALELAPNYLQALSALRRLNPSDKNLEKQLAEVEELMQRIPDNAPLKAEYASMLKSQADGLRYEEAEKEYIHLRPRDPFGYYRLGSWYLFQSREDLAIQILQQGRELIGIEEMPLWECEQSAKHEAEDDISSDVEPEENSAKPKQDQSEPAPALIESKVEQGKQFSKETQDTSADDDNALSIAQEDTPPACTPETLLKNARNACFEPSLSEHPDTLPEVKAALEWDQAHKFTWQESLTLLGYRLLACFNVFSYQRMRGKALKLLNSASPLPGPFPFNLESFLKQFNISNLTRLEAEVLREWAEKQSENRPLSSELAFTMALLKEAMRESFNAEQEYLAMVKKFPNDVRPRFRRAELLHHRQHIDKAISEYHEVLKFESGHYGSIKALLDYYSTIGDSAGALKWSERIFQFKPYCYYDLVRYLSTMAKVKGFDAAFKFLESLSSRFSDKQIAYCTAELLIDQRRPREARNLILNVKLAQTEPLLAHFIKVRSLLNNKNLRPALNAVNEALEDFPNNTWFIERKGFVLYHVNPRRALNYMVQKVSQGFLNKDFISSIVELSEEHPVETAINLIRRAQAEYKVNIAFSFLDVFRSWDAGLTHDLACWEVEQFPWVTAFKEELINSCISMREDKRAEKYAKELLALDNFHPYWISLMARSLKHRKPHKAVEYFMTAYDQTGDVHYLDGAAHCYHIMGNDAKARELLFKIVKHDPLSGASIFNLVKLGERPSRFVSQLFRLVTLPLSVSDEMVHVLAVRAAHGTGRKVPFAWHSTAEERFQILLDDDSEKVAEERLLLGLALAAWYKVHADPERQRFYFKKSANPIERLKKSLLWPGKNWIPHGRD